MKREDVRLCAWRRVFWILSIVFIQHNQAVFAETSREHNGLAPLNAGAVSRPFAETSAPVADEKTTNERMKKLVDALNSDRTKLIDAIKGAKGKEARQKAADELLKRLGKDTENPGPVPPEVVKLVDALRDAEAEPALGKALENLKKALSPDGQGKDVKVDDLKKAVEELKKAAVVEDREKTAKQVLKQLGLDGLHAFREKGILNKDRLKEALGLNDEQAQQLVNESTRDPGGSVGIPITPGPLPGKEGTPSPSPSPTDPGVGERPPGDGNVRPGDNNFPGAGGLDPGAGLGAGVDPNALDDNRKLNDLINDLRNGRNGLDGNGNNGQGKDGKNGKGAGGGDGDGGKKGGEGQGSGLQIPPITPPSIPPSKGPGEPPKKEEGKEPTPPPDLTGLLMKMAFESGKDQGINPELAKYLANPFGDKKTGEKDPSFADQIVGDLNRNFATAMQMIGAMGNMWMANINRPANAITTTNLQGEGARNVRSSMAAIGGAYGKRGRGRGPRVPRGGPRGREPAAGGASGQRRSPRSRAPARRGSARSIR